MTAATDGFVERAVLERTALHVARSELANAVVELEPLAQVLSHRMVAPAREAILRARAALACIDQDGAA